MLYCESCANNFSRTAARRGEEKSMKRKKLKIMKSTAVAEKLFAVVENSAVDDTFSLPGTFVSESFR